MSTHCKNRVRFLHFEYLDLSEIHESKSRVNRVVLEKRLADLARLLKGFGSIENWMTVQRQLGRATSRETERILTAWSFSAQTCLGTPGLSELHMVEQAQDIVSSDPAGSMIGLRKPHDWFIKEVYTALTKDGAKCSLSSGNGLTNLKSNDPKNDPIVKNPKPFERIIAFLAWGLDARDGVALSFMYTIRAAVYRKKYTRTDPKGLL